MSGRQMLQYLETRSVLKALIGKRNIFCSGSPKINAGHSFTRLHQRSFVNINAGEPCIGKSARTIGKPRADVASDVEERFYGSCYPVRCLHSVYCADPMRKPFATWRAVNPAGPKAIVVVSS